MGQEDPERNIERNQETSWNQCPPRSNGGGDHGLWGPPRTYHGTLSHFCPIFSATILILCILDVTSDNFCHKSHVFVAAKHPIFTLTSSNPYFTPLVHHQRVWKKKKRDQRALELNRKINLHRQLNRLFRLSLFLQSSIVVYIQRCFVC